VLKGAALVNAKRQAIAHFEQGLRVSEVAKATGIQSKTLYSWHRMWRQNGTDRLMARPETHETTPLTLQEREVLDGLMLGDGCLSLGKNSRNPCLRITRTATDLDYIHWTADVFRARLTDASVRVRTIFDSRTRKHYEQAKFRTRCDSALRAPHLRWYPDGTKVVPDDLRLSAVAVAVWFADDGSVCAASRRSPEIKFATHGFQGSDVQRLADLLSDRYEERFPVYAAGKPGQFMIRAGGSAAKALLRDIDPVFPPLARKADRWRDSELLTDRVAPPPCPRCASNRVYRWARIKGVQQFKCQACSRVFRESYERVGRIPQLDPDQAARSTRIAGHLAGGQESEAAA
jgi:transposase-like protein